MPEPLLAATVRLTAAAEALAALAAHARVQSEHLDIDPDIAELLARIAAELVGSATFGPDDPVRESVGMARAMMHEAVALVDDPARRGGWATTDPVVLEGVGRVSMSIATVIANLAPQLDGLADALARTGATFLDIGTGTGWLALALARTFPATTVTGIDVFEPALERARHNVASESMGDRIELRSLDVTELADADADAYDAIWLPLPFLPAVIVPDAIAASVRALRPGGWLLPGTFAGPDEPVARLLTELRIRRSGGYPWQSAQFVEMLSAAGLLECHEVPRTWPAPVQLFAARKAR